MAGRGPLPRLADVAALAGVTPMTVSRALRDPGKVTPETLARVRAAVSQTGYVPNSLAGSLAAGGPTRVVAVLIPTIQHAIFADTVTGLSEALGPRGYHLMVGQTGYRRDEEDALLHAFLGYRPDGLVLTGVTHSRASLALLRRLRTPVVETWELTRRPVDMVAGFSNERAAHAMVAHLVAAGYRRVLFVSGPARANERARRREIGYRRACRELGLPELDILTIGSPAAPRIEDGARVFARVLALAPRPDAIFFTSDVYAVGALQEAERLGIDVPGAIGVAGFHDLEISRVVRPALTTVHVPALDIGLAAGRMLLARLEGDAALAERAATVPLPFTVVQRASTRAPPAP